VLFNRPVIAVSQYPRPLDVNGYNLSLMTLGSLSFYDIQLYVCNNGVKLLVIL
jgi:hypothetical protein